MACKQSHYAELRNAYAGVLQSKVQYTSDSNGYWIYRSWEQLLDEKHNRIQVLTHPEWWLTQEADPAEKVCRELQHRSQFCWTAYRRLLERGRDNKTGLTVAKDLLPALFQEDGERLLMLWLDGRIELAYFETFCRLECRARSLAKELLRCQLQIPATQVTELLEDHQLQLDPLRCLALVAETQIVDLIGLDEPTFRKVKNHLKTTAHVTGGVAKLELAESFDQICFAISNLTQWVKSRYFDFEESAMLSTAETPSTGANHETLLSWLKQHQKALKLHDCALAGFLNGS